VRERNAIIEERNFIIKEIYNTKKVSLGGAVKRLILRSFFKSAKKQIELLVREVTRRNLP
jgi:hypothetical protein